MENKSGKLSKTKQSKVEKRALNTICGPTKFVTTLICYRWMEKKPQKCVYNVHVRLFPQPK